MKRIIFTHSFNRNFFLLTFFSTLLFAQETIQTEFLSIGDGLSSATVQPIIQDSYGLIWVGTDNGLHNYDGYKFTRYKNIPGKSTSLLNDVIWGLAEDADKNIWIGTDEGISKYERINNEFVNYDFSELFGLASETGGRVFNIFVDSKNNIWAASLGLHILLYDRTNDQWNRVPIRYNNETDDILTGGITLTIIEDKNGKIWAGSRSYGLVSYNIEDSCFVSEDIKTENSLIDFTTNENYITDIYADITNTLWITTRNGVFKYNQETHELKVIQEYNYAKLLLWNNWNEILPDQSGNIWIANNYRGILKFDGVSDEFTEININGREKRKDGSSDIIFTRAMLDNTGIIWFGSTINGIMKYDASREPFINYKYSETDKNSISSNQVFCLLESKFKKDNIYVGTRGGGLNLFNQKKQTFSKINYNVIKDQFGGSVRSIAEEDDGSLWLGTWGDGLINVDRNYKEISRYTLDSSSFNSLSDNSVRVIKKDNYGNYWIGTNQGLNLLNPKTKKLKRISSLLTRTYPQELYEKSSKFIKELKYTARIEKVSDSQNLSKPFKVIKPRKYLVISGGEGDNNDNLMYDFGWIQNSKNDTIWKINSTSTTYHLGGALKNRIVIDIIDLKPGEYNLLYKSDDSHSYNNWNQDAPLFPEFWGITIVELPNEQQVVSFESFLNESDDGILIEGNNIRSIQISGNNVWIGTDANGLNKINLEDNSVKIYNSTKEKENSLSNNSVQFIYEDPEGILWLATNLGLNKFDPVNETFKVYTEDDGLPTNYIASILPGDGKDLWLATRNGISKMVTDLETGQVTFVNYDTEDGIEGMDFIALVALKASNGQYFFGSEQGLSAFTPGNSNTTEPDLIFSDIKISNKSVKSYDIEDRPFKTSLLELENLALSYDQNDLTFSFAALHYSKPSKNQYAHKLVGYDKDWVYDNKREVTYTNLDPGDYTFSIKGSNRDGVWKSTPKSISIVINPPWWFTTWAYIGYGFLFLGIIFIVDRVQRKRLLAKTKERMKLQEAELRAESAELQAKAAEAERKLLEAENSRKTEELEEARALQLSMLPKELPVLPNLDIAVYMKTASEVGGDYYDFHIDMDGKLTVVLGDATGHGMKAGTMVTTTKSLFNVLAPNPSIVETFHEMTRCLKMMQLEKLSMCMTMLKITENKLQMSAAGMPPVFIYKRENQVTEEHVIKGMPLGTFSEFPYTLIESNIKSGDAILLMSDGLPELVNSEDEIFGYKRVRNIFEEVAGSSPEEIIRKLKDAGSDWVKDNDPDDDVTFVVIKVK
ncbi:MAG: SpoIIE family protein phosphatase [Ignavibacteriales bacterium]|nr:SpoIIE family protein phosphatase [Ignavibacteriales bacterium]